MAAIKFPGKVSLSLLLDPDKIQDRELGGILDVAVRSGVDYIMTGGSLTFRSVDDLIRSVKEYCRIPVVLFPGNLLQLSREADLVMLRKPCYCSTTSEGYQGKTDLGRLYSHRMRFKNIR